MFILDTDQLPETLQSLTTAIDASLRGWIALPASATAVTATGTFPSLSTLALDISDGQISSDTALPFDLHPQADLPGPTVASFTLIGHPIRLTGIPISLDLTAANASFAYARAPSNKLIAALQSASDGHLSLRVTQADLEAAVLQLARQFAGDNVSIQKIAVTLSSISPTQVGILLTITAKKFVTAIIRVSGQLALDDQMVATATDLKAVSDGMVGNIAVGLLQPQLQKLEGRPLPLLAFSLGNVKLRGVQVDTARGLQVSAFFGDASA